MEQDAFKAAERLLRSNDPHQIDLALEMYERFVRENPDDPIACFELGGAYDFLGREEVAIAHYERVLAMGVERLPNEEQPKLYLQMGSTLRNLGRLEESRDLFLRGLRIYPDFNALRAFLALTEYSMGHFQEAAKLWLDCLVEGSTDPSIQRYARSLRGYRDVL